MKGYLYPPDAYEWMTPEQRAVLLSHIPDDHVLNVARVFNVGPVPEMRWDLRLTWVDWDDDEAPHYRVADVVAAGDLYQLALGLLLAHSLQVPA